MLILPGRDAPVLRLIHDHDEKFTGAFDEIFATEAIEVIRTPVRAPKANAFAERWVRTVWGECLDWLLIVSRRHLERVLRIYVDHYNYARPHRSLGLGTPESAHGSMFLPYCPGSVEHRDRSAAWFTSIAVRRDGTPVCAPFTRERALEVARDVLRSPVVAQRDTAPEVGVDRAAASRARRWSAQGRRSDAQVATQLIEALAPGA